VLSAVLLPQLPNLQLPNLQLPTVDLSPDAILALLNQHAGLKPVHNVTLPVSGIPAAHQLLTA
jgi:hypothetical protein